MSNWLDSVRVGDEVVMTNSHNQMRKGKVTKITKTMIHAFGYRWNRRNGVEVGPKDGWHYAWLVEPTPGALKECESRGLQSRFYEALRAAQHRVYGEEAMKSVLKVLGDASWTRR